MWLFILFKLEVLVLLSCLFHTIHFYSWFRPVLVRGKSNCKSTDLACISFPLHHSSARISHIGQVGIPLTYRTPRWYIAAIASSLVPAPLHRQWGILVQPELAGEEVVQESATIRRTPSHNLSKEKLGLVSQMEFGGQLGHCNLYCFWCCCYLHGVQSSTYILQKKSHSKATEANNRGLRNLAGCRMMTTVAISVEIHFDVNNNKDLEPPQKGYSKKLWNIFITAQMTNPKCEYNSLKPKQEDKGECDC